MKENESNSNADLLCSEKPILNLKKLAELESSYKHNNISYSALSSMVINVLSDNPSIKYSLSYKTLKNLGVITSNETESKQVNS